MYGILIGGLLLALLPLTPLGAQEIAGDTVMIRSIFDELALPREGEGRVFVMQSDFIRSRVHDCPSGMTHGSIAESFTYRQGFRVQVFSSNAIDARSTASKRAELLREAFPDIETEVLYKAPFWSVRTGNFFNREEARQFLDELKSRFPDLAREMYIVPSKIKIPLL